MDWETARNKAILWMIKREWRFKLAKRKELEQSLFEHTLIQLDLLMSLFPLLQRREAFGLTEEEMKVLWLATLAHDVGKETQAWQSYIRGQGPSVSHCIPEIAKEALAGLMAEYGWEENLLTAAVSGVLLHMRESRTPSMILSQVIAGQAFLRWKMLAEITDAIDNLVSTNGLFAGMASLERGTFAPHLKSAYHLATLRGISTVLLHKAANDAFVEARWIPLIHYTNGSIYVAGVSESPTIPDRNSILHLLSQDINRAMGSEFSQRVVGSPVASMVPKPDLFDYREMREYLKVAADRVGSKTFQKKKPEARQKTLQRYLLALCQREENRCPSPRECHKNRKCHNSQGLLPNSDLEYQSDRLGRAHPEMVVFKFFKTVFSDKAIDCQKFELPAAEIERIAKKFPANARDEKVLEKYDKEISKAQKALWTSLLEAVKNTYDEKFGPGAFELLQKTTTLMPDLDMAYAIDLFWSLPCSRFLPGGDNTPIEHLPDDRRTEILVETLSAIADGAFASLDECNRPKRVEVEKIAESFMRDLICPAEREPFIKLVEEQLQAYKGTKPLARKAGGLHLCPVCNHSFAGGTNARADFLPNPESHTNRAPSHGSPGYIVICDACKYERFLQQQILGGKVAQMMVLMPRMNIGYYTGQVLKNKVQQIWEEASMLMSAENPDPHKRFSLSRTGEIARRLHESEAGGITPEELVQVFTCKTGKDKLKEYRRQLKTFLNENIGEGLAKWNEDFDTDFQSEDDFLSGVENLSIPDSSGLLKEIRGKAYKLIPQLRFVCETPHLILVPIRNPITVSDKESEANVAIRELFVMLVVGLTLDCSVAMIREGEELNFTGGEGIVRVPAVPSLRKLVGCEWLGIDDAEKWKRAIAATAQVAYAADYPERSNLYQILSSPSPGHILRRIEMKSSGYVYPENFLHLEIIREVLS
ncbi:MAG: hypothetical protein KGZ57_09545 [Dethiobacter sp.]|nr:hypothetical protein [Dethiobacter sp.]